MPSAWAASLGLYSSFSTVELSFLSRGFRRLRLRHALVLTSSGGAGECEFGPGRRGVAASVVGPGGQHHHGGFV